MGAERTFTKLADLTDRATADLPAINTPLAAALQALTDAVGEKAAQSALDALAASVSNVDNTRDTDKPVSSAQQVALDLKADSSSLGTAATADSGDFATAAQGALADSATQPSDLGTAALVDVDDMGDVGARSVTCASVTASGDVSCEGLALGSSQGWLIKTDDYGQLVATNGTSTKVITEPNPLTTALVANLESASQATTVAQRVAIDDFFNLGGEEGWIAELQRLYLFIWGAANPNSIDWIAGGTGTFNGTITHATGYSTGDGSTGYFDLGASPVDLGMSAGRGGISALIHAPGTSNQYIGGSYVSGTQRTDLQRRSTDSALQFTWSQYVNSTTHLYDWSTDSDGIVSASKRNQLERVVQRRDGTTTQLGEVSRANDTTLPTNNIFAFARGDGTAAGHYGGSLGAFGIDNGMTETQQNAYVAALGTLWEQLTGLTLP